MPNTEAKLMKKLLISSALVLVTAPTVAQQTHYYNSLGTSSTNSSGATTFYHSCGNVTGHNTFMREVWAALLCRCSPQKMRCDGRQATPTASLP
jgi:hypothetical protein